MNMACCMLAGGQGQRMGHGDKGLIQIDGQTILDTLIERFSHHSPLLLNANGDTSRFARFDIPIIPDEVSGFQGPLAGIHAALSYLVTSHPTVSHCLIIPTDAPFLPQNLGEICASHLAKAPLISVRSHGRTHPVIGLWPVSVLPQLTTALCDRDIRKIDAFTTEMGCHYVDFDAAPDPFLNLNRPSDLAALQEAGLHQIDLAFFQQSK